MKLLKGKRWKPTLCLATFTFVHVASDCAEVKPVLLVAHVQQVCPVVRFNMSKSIRLVSRKLRGRYQESMYLVNWVISFR